ncbi:beta-ketoacyl reductase [Streptomyces thinghirensis]|nr:beta-ketoacyl reductase [Streptomyces thinghirensis]
MTGRLTVADRDRVARSGLLPLTGEAGMTLFDTALRGQDPAPVAGRFDLRGIRERSVTAGVPALLRGLVRPPRGMAAAQAGDGGESWSVRLAAMAAAADRPGTVLELIRTQVALVLGLPGAEAVDEEQAFKDAGFDSLTAVELRNRLASAAGVRLPPTLVFDFPTPVALTRRLLAELVPEPDGEAEPRGGTREGTPRGAGDRAARAPPRARCTRHPPRAGGVPDGRGAGGDRRRRLPAAIADMDVWAAASLWRDGCGRGSKTGR